MKHLLLILTILILTTTALVQADYTQTLNEGVGVGLTAGSVDSTHVKTFGLAGSNLISPLRIPTLHVTDVTASRGTFGMILADSLFLRLFPSQLLVLPTAPDTTVVSGKDSLTVLTLYKPGNAFTTVEYLHAFGNGTAPADTTRYGALFLPSGDHPDAATIWARSNSGPGDSTGVQVTLRKANKTAADTATVASYDLNITTANTWEEFTIPLLRPFTDEPYVVEYQVWCKGSYWIEAGRIYFK